MSTQMKLGQNPSNKQYHIALTPEIGCKYAILPGDPGRVEAIAAKLARSKFEAENREFKSYSGFVGETKVIVTSTGIGGASAAIALEELFKCGVRTFLRVGTCGGMQAEVQPGDLVIASGAVRAEGTSNEYLPEGYPAVSDFAVTSALCKAAQSQNLRFHTGVVHSKDSFYGQTEPESMVTSAWLKERWDMYIHAGCLASEMEAASLFSVGLTRRARVGVVLTAIWNPELAKRQSAQEYFDNTNAITCAVEAIRLLAGS